jgi:hypothetical protein
MLKEANATFSVFHPSQADQQTIKAICAHVKRLSSRGSQSIPLDKLSIQISNDYSKITAQIKQSRMKLPTPLACDRC